MPNGHVDDSGRAELERFFAPIAETLETFARQHNLKLERYYHDAPVWQFTFRHPAGGIGKIEVSRHGEEKIRPSLAWWFDDYDTLQRHTKIVVENELEMKPELITRDLEAALRLILSWKFGQWDNTYKGNDVWKRTWTRDEFVKLLDQYPLPR